MTTYNAVKKLALGVALSGLFAWQASANIQYGYVNFSLTGSGEVASGQLFGEINGGTMEVTSGYFDGTSGPILGNIPIYPNPIMPGIATSPSGMFVYDDLAFPSTIMVDSAGGPLFASGGTEINIWNNGSGSQWGPAGSYGFQEVINGSAATGYLTGTLSMSQFVPVPEAGLFAVAGVGLLGLVYFGRCYSLKLKLA